MAIHPWIVVRTTAPLASLAFCGFGNQTARFAPGRLNFMRNLVWWCESGNAETLFWERGPIWESLAC